MQHIERRAGFKRMHAGILLRKIHWTEIITRAKGQGPNGLIPALGQHSTLVDLANGGSSTTSSSNHTISDKKFACNVRPPNSVQNPPIYLYCEIKSCCHGWCHGSRRGCESSLSPLPSIRSSRLFEHLGTSACKMGGCP